MKVSIIMPAYNSEKYISTAIESIQAQTYTDFELIIVDDGSNDETLNICKAYQCNDGRIKIFKKKNGGCCTARNYGINKASGDYITFCDNDDTFDNALLEENLYLAEKYDADVVKWNFTTYVDGKEGRVRKYKNQILLNDIDIAQNYLEVRQTNDAIWNGMYKKSFLDVNRIEFNEFMQYGGEDLNFSLQTLYHHPRLILNNKSYYNWYMRTNHSTSAKFHANFCDTMLINAEYEYMLVKALNADTLWRGIRDEYYNYILSYASHISFWEEIKYKRIMKKKKWCI